MALSANSMKDKIKQKIEAINNWPNPGQSPVFVSDEILTAFCEGIIEELTTAGVIIPGSFAAGGDPVTGTGQIT